MMKIKVSRMFEHSGVAGSHSVKEFIQALCLRR